MDIITIDLSVSSENRLIQFEEKKKLLLIIGTYTAKRSFFGVFHFSLSKFATTVEDIILLTQCVALTRSKVQTRLQYIIDTRVYIFSIPRIMRWLSVCHKAT